MRGRRNLDAVTNLLVFGDRVQKLRVQFGVVLGQGLVSIVIDELHHSEEGKRLREAVPALSVVNLYELVIPSFPIEGDKEDKNYKMYFLVITERILFLIFCELTGYN